MKQLGVSPKVVYPALIQVVGGTVLLAFGHDAEGTTALVTGLGTLAVGYQLPVGVVDPVIGESSDDALHPDVLKRVKATRSR